MLVCLFVRLIACVRLVGCLLVCSFGWPVVCCLFVCACVCVFVCLIVCLFGYCCVCLHV